VNLRKWSARRGVGGMSEMSAPNEVAVPSDGGLVRPWHGGVPRPIDAPEFGLFVRQRPRHECRSRAGLSVSSCQSSSEGGEGGRDQGSRIRGRGEVRWSASGRPGSLDVPGAFLCALAWGSRALYKALLGRCARIHGRARGALRRRAAARSPPCGRATRSPSTSTPAGSTRSRQRRSTGARPATPRPARATASSRAELLGREPARGADPTARRSKAVGVPGSYG
jgi:hypothetical protein